MSNCIKERRIGRFEIAVACAERDPESVMLALSKMVIVRADCDYASNAFRYTAYSPMFPTVPEGAIVPEYRLIHHEWTDDDGQYYHDVSIDPELVEYSIVSDEVALGRSEDHDEG